MKGKEMKKRHGLIGVLTALVLASFNSAVPPGEPASKDSKDSAQINPKGRDSSNVQWRADPQKGWVRDEGRHKLDQDHKEQSKQHRKGNNQSRSH
jgi:hypothetical protein